MAIKVHVLEDFDAQTLAELRAKLDARVSLTDGSNAPLETQLLVAGRPRREQLQACPNLRAVIVPWAGIPEGTQQLLRAGRQCRIV